MAWVSLESLIKTPDLSHYKSSTGWSFSDLSQYFDTDWNLALIPMGNSRLLSKTNDEYIFSYAWASSDSYYAFPLKEKVNIKAIRYDAKLTQADYKDANARLDYVLYPDNFSGGNKRLRIAYANSITSEDFLVSDFNYHTYTKNLDEDYETEYIGFSAIAGAWCFKNVEVLIELKITSNGGGATHIAKVTGQLKDLSNNLSDILMVSGGGGGGFLVGDTDYSGKEAGGISGSGDNSADQSTGNAFGQGESGTDVSGGGSGLYGGYKGTSSKSGGAGSGYIGNGHLTNKKMVGYNVPTSSVESTKTESVNTYNSSHVPDTPKAGNGHARIKFIRERIVEVITKSNEESLPSQVLWGTSIGCSIHFDPSTDFIVMNVKASYASNERFFFQSRLGAMLSNVYPSEYGLRANVKNCIGHDQDAEWLLVYGKSNVSYNAMVVETEIALLQVEDGKMVYETFTKSVTSGTNTTMKSVDITKGKWVIVCNIQYQTDNIRYLGKITSNNTELAAQSGYDNSGWVACNIATIVEVNNTTTFTLESICSKSCDTTGFIKAIEIG